RPVKNPANQCKTPSYKTFQRFDRRRVKAASISDGSIVRTTVAEFVVARVIDYIQQVICVSSGHFFDDSFDGFDRQEIVIPVKQQIAHQIGQVTARHLRAGASKTPSLIPGFVLPGPDNNRIESSRGEISRCRQQQAGEKPSKKVLYLAAVTQDQTQRSIFVG